MALIRLPISYTQFSPYVEGTLRVKWFDPNAVSSVADFSSGASGIDSVTYDLTGAQLVVTFSSTSSSGSDIDFETAFNGSTGLGLTVPDDYNKNIIFEIEVEAEVGSTQSTKSPLFKTITHQIAGLTDSVFTSSPATVQHNETEANAGTTKSLGTYSINDVDTGATYTVNITYDKTVGSITYNNTTFLNTSASDKDVLTTTNVTNLNSVLSDLQYKPLFVASPGTNQNALQGQTITIEITSDKDDKITDNKVTVSPTIDNTLQFSKSGSAPSFTESDTTGKTLGTFGVSPTLTIPSVTFTATVTYDKTKGTITYPDTSIVTSFTNRDEVSTNNLATLNTALSSATYLPIKFQSGEDLETIAADTITITVTSSPSLVIANSTQTVTTTVSNSDEISAPSSITYSRMKPQTFTATITDSPATTEIYAIVFDPSENIGTIELAKNDQAYTLENGTATDLGNLDTLGVSAPTFSIYQGTGAAGTDISSNSFIIQGTKDDINAVMALNSRGTTADKFITSNAVDFMGEMGDRGTRASVTGISQTNPVEITAAGHPFVNGELVNFTQISGGHPLNSTTVSASTDGSTGRVFGRNTFFKVASKTSNTFNLQTMSGSDVDGTSFPSYSSSSGGEVTGIINPGVFLCPKFKNQSQSLTNGTFSIKLFKAPAGTSSSIDLNTSFSTFSKIFERTQASLTETGVGFGVRENVPSGNYTGTSAKDGTNARAFSFSRSGSTNIINPITGMTGDLSTNVMTDFASPDFFSIDMRDNNTYIGRLLVDTDQQLSGVAQDAALGSAGSSFNFGGGFGWNSGNGTNGATTQFISDGFTEVGRYGGSLIEVALFLFETQHTIGGNRSGANTGPAVGSDWRYRYMIEINDGQTNGQTDLSKITFFDVTCTVVT